jgi:hypothetical protein
MRAGKGYPLLVLKRTRTRGRSGIPSKQREREGKRGIPSSGVETDASRGREIPSPGFKMDANKGDPLLLVLKRTRTRRKGIQEGKRG